MLIKMSIWARPLIYQFFKGDQFYDPIDGRSYRKFLPYGYGKQRENALSPGTLSLERHRQMWLYLQNETDFFIKNYKVLHIAPEQEFLRKFKRMSNLNYISADLYSPIVDVKADILDLPFENDSFDIIFCNHVLEHIEDDAKAMSELYRVMKPGGWGILQVPMKNSLEKTYEDFTIKDPKERQKHFLPMRVEAYQRAALLMERIHPGSLVMRLHTAGSPARKLQTELLQAIREEYDHNVSQQMFISPQAWEMVRNSKEETIKIINLAGNQMDATALSTDLAGKIFEIVAEVGKLPTEITVEYLRKELQELF